ncbi:MAG: PHB depolymerase family esterase [Polyangiales bacterium]
MMSVRMACVLTVLMGCARGATLEGEQRSEDPVTGQPDAGDTPLPTPTVDATVPRETGPIMQDDPPRDAGQGVDDTRPLDATIADAGTPTVETGTPDAGPIVTGPGTLSVRTLTVGSASRRYLLYLPGGLDPKAPVALISVHHPYAQDGQYMADITSFTKIADRDRIAVAFPDGGSATPWNVGTNVCNWGTVGGAPSTQDDIGFVRAIAADVPNVQAVSKLFVAGLDMGAYFAHHIGCQGRDVVRAISAHSGGTYPGTCPGEPIPALVIHGDADTLIPLQCATQALGYWVTRNGCGTTTTREPIKQGECLWNTGCPAGREVGMCTLKGMDHGWAGAPITGNWLQSEYGGGVPYEDAAELMWKFFKKYL